jgi:hypothetical protein
MLLARFEGGETGDLTHSLAEGCTSGWRMQG